MRRLRPEDGTPAHRRAAGYHITKCKQGKAPLFGQLAAEMTAHRTALRSNRTGPYLTDRPVLAFSAEHKPRGPISFRRNDQTQSSAGHELVDRSLDSEVPGFAFTLKIVVAGQYPALTYLWVPGLDIVSCRLIVMLRININKVQLTCSKERGSLLGCHAEHSAATSKCLEPGSGFVEDPILLHLGDV